MVCLKCAIIWEGVFGILQRPMPMRQLILKSPDGNPIEQVQAGTGGYDAAAVFLEELCEGRPSQLTVPPLGMRPSVGRLDLECERE